MVQTYVIVEGRKHIVCMLVFVCLHVSMYVCSDVCVHRFIHKAVHARSNVKVARFDPVYSTRPKLPCFAKAGLNSLVQPDFPCKRVCSREHVRSEVHMDTGWLIHTCVCVCACRS